MVSINYSLKVAAALSKAQQKFDPILKDTNNPFYKSKYATLDQVISATRPHLQEQGLVMIQRNIRRDQEAGIKTRLLHLESGEELESELTAPPKEQTIQQITGILTYARRYEYLTVLGLAPEDDDGNTASGKDTDKGYTEPSRRPQSAQLGGEPRLHTSRPDSGPVKANIPPAPTSTAPPAAAPAPTTTSAPKPTADPNTIPNAEEYSAYASAAGGFVTELQKAGLTGNLTQARAKFKKYISKVGGVEDIKHLTIGRWDVFFSEFRKMMSTLEGQKQAVELIEAAAKESK